jgi:hypothetical protein
MNIAAEFAAENWAGFAGPTHAQQVFQKLVDKARREALEEAAQIAENAWLELACPNHYSGQVAKNAGRIAARSIRKLARS